MASPMPVCFLLVLAPLAWWPTCQAGDCKGHRQVLRGPPGYVTDGPGNYSVNGNCEWLIKGLYFSLITFHTVATFLANVPNGNDTFSFPLHLSAFQAPSSSYRIVLNFTFMDTECTYDYLFVYDGDSYQSPLLASLSGNTLPQPIEATSGKVLVYFRSFFC